MIIVKRILSSLIYFAILGVFGAMVWASMPGGPELTLPQRVSDRLAQPGAPGLQVSTINYTAIAIPLMVTDTIHTADDVAAYINASNPPTSLNSIQRVARWDEASQGFVIRNVGSPFGIPDFDVAVGDFLLVGANADAPTSFSWVGDVPPVNFRSYELVANGYTSMMLPLNRSDLLTADDLGNDVGDVQRVAYWNEASQGLVIRNVNSMFGTPDFDIKIGYPYLLYATTEKTWPQ